MYIKHILFILVILASLGTKAQDIHFSQFYAAPLLLNPAETGNFNGDWRFCGNYRNQWKAFKNIPFTTTAISYDRPFYLYTEKISGGLSFVHDKSSSIALSVTKIYLSGSYTKEFSGHHFYLGIQGGYVKKDYNFDGITFPNQFDMDLGGFNSSLPNEESNLNNKLSYVDVNAGLLWTKRFNKIQPKIGFATYHVNFPTESFLSEQSKLPVRSVFYSNVLYDITPKIYIKPKLLYMVHSAATDMLLGLNIGYHIKTTIQSVYVGAHYRDGYNRNTDAFFAVAGVKFKNAELGISYDINISDLKAATRNKGAWEVSLIITGASSILEQITLPCDRY